MSNHDDRLDGNLVSATSLDWALDTLKRAHNSHLFPQQRILSSESVYGGCQHHGSAVWRVESAHHRVLRQHSRKPVHLRDSPGWHLCGAASSARFTHNVGQILHNSPTSPSNAPRHHQELRKVLRRRCRRDVPEPGFFSVSAPIYLGTKVASHHSVLENSIPAG